MSDPEANAGEVTRILSAIENGNAQAAKELLPLVYDELHRLAQRHMRRERPNHTLQTTALVNETYLRLVDSSRVRWRDRAHSWRPKSAAWA